MKIYFKQEDSRMAAVHFSCIFSSFRQDELLFFNSVCNFFAKFYPLDDWLIEQCVFVVVAVFVVNHSVQFWCHVHHALWGRDDRTAVGQDGRKNWRLCQFCLDVLHDADWQCRLLGSGVVHPKRQTRFAQFLTKAAQHFIQNSSLKHRMDFIVMLRRLMWN